MTKLTKPWRISIEQTFGCDNRCPMCYKQVLNKPKGEYEYLTPNTALEISKKIKKANWDNLRIEFDLRGEPTLNPYLCQNIKIIRDNLPKSQLTLYTNGNTFNKQKAHSFFKNGGNIIIMDCYKNDLQQRKKEYSKDFVVYDYYNGEFNPFLKHSPKTKVICLMDNIMTRNGEKRTRLILNQAGNVDWNKVKKFGLKPLKQPLKKKCVKPFRELIINYQGNIVLCCHDGEPTHILGNIYNINDLKDFWHNNYKLNIIRLLLYNKYRNFPLCSSCNYHGGMRQGLLPKMKTITPEQAKEYTKEVISLK